MLKLAHAMKTFQFRVRARDCGPKMASAINEKSEGNLNFSAL